MWILFFFILLIFCGIDFVVILFDKFSGYYLICLLIVIDLCWNVYFFCFMRVFGNIFFIVKDMLFKLSLKFFEGVIVSLFVIIGLNFK